MANGWKVLVVGVALLLSAKLASAAVHPEESSRTYRLTPPSIELNAAAGPAIEAEVKDGVCLTKITEAADQATKDRYGDHCAKLLFPVSGVLNVPGLLFIGGAFGTVANKFAIAPAVGVNGGAAIPIHRPSLGWYKENKNNPEDPLRFRLPTIPSFYANFLISANVAVAGFIYPGTPSAAGSGTGTDLAFSIGMFSGIELGGISFAEGGKTKSRIAATVGVILGYLGNSSTVGDAFLIGAQPGFTASFN